MNTVSPFIIPICLKAQNLNFVMKKQDDHSKNDFFSYATEVQICILCYQIYSTWKTKLNLSIMFSKKKKNMNLMLALIVRYLMGFFKKVKSTPNKSKINQRWKL